MNAGMLFKVGTTYGGVEPEAAALGSLRADPAAGRVPADIDGEYGTFSFARVDSTGKLTWTYDLDLTTSEISSLYGSQRLYDKLTVVANDGGRDSDPITAVVAITGKGTPSAGSTIAPTLHYRNGRDSDDGMRMIYEDHSGNPDYGWLYLADADTAFQDLTIKYGFTTSTTTEPDAAGPSALSSRDINGQFGTIESTTGYGRWTLRWAETSEARIEWAYELRHFSRTSVHGLEPGERHYHKLTLVLSDGVNDSAPITALVTINGLEGDYVPRITRSSTDRAFDLEASISEDSTSTVGGDLFTRDVDLWARFLEFRLGVTSGNTEPAAANVSGVASVDVDTGNNGVVMGEYGVFDLTHFTRSSGSDGRLAWTYRLKTQAEDSTAYNTVQALNDGQSLYEKLTIVANNNGRGDGVPFELLVEITGATDSSGSRGESDASIAQDFA